MSRIAHAVVASPIGFLALTETDEHLTQLTFVGKQAQLIAPNSAVLREAYAQLQQYFVDPSHAFSIPYQLIGTPYRMRVWAQIARIPVGATQSYAQLADALNSAPRAVGGACGANPLPLIVPCHRVVARHGIGGFNAQRDGQDWLPIKRWLLAHEQQT